MSAFELCLPPKPSDRNLKTGRFLKGRTPHNKGKTWNEFMGKRAQKRASKGWANLLKYAPKKRPDIEADRGKTVVAIDRDGNWTTFPSISAAAKWLGCSQGRASNCIIHNEEQRPLLSTHGRPTCRVNTDHQVRGIRLYYADGEVWKTKIRKV